MNVGRSFAVITHVRRPAVNELAIIRGKKWFLELPSNRPERMQHFLKAASRAAWAEIVPAQLFAEFLVPMNDAHATFHLRFGWETLATFAGDFEAGVFMIMCVVCHTASSFEYCG